MTARSLPHSAAITAQISAAITAQTVKRRLVAVYGGSHYSADQVCSAAITARLLSFRAHNLKNTTVTSESTTINNLASSTPLSGPGTSHSLTSSPPQAQTEVPPDDVTPENYPQASVPVTGKIRKTFNLDTYKYHALADYSSSIRRFGTTDSYSTERGESEHLLPKSWYLRTDKKTYTNQLAQIERRWANLRKIGQRVQAESVGAHPTAQLSMDDAARSPLPLPYKVAKSQNTFRTTQHYRPQKSNGRDPALLNFLPKLQNHLLPRVKEALQCRHSNAAGVFGTENSEATDFVSIRDSRIYEHKTIRICYTSYDARQAEDIVCVGGPKAIVMVLNPSYPADNHAHPYLYAKVHGIFHANVLYMNGSADPNPERIDFLWVRWFQSVGSSTSSYGLHLLSFPPLIQEDAFGFLDPADVVQSCHLIPRFSETESLLQKSLSATAQDADDCSAYFLNPFPDRDMYMRYQWGYAVGHEYTHSSALQASLTPVGVLDAQSAYDHADARDRPSQPIPPGLNDSSNATSDHHRASPMDTSTHEHSSEAFQQAEDTQAEELGEDDWVYRSDPEEHSDEDDVIEDDPNDLDAE
ncbi:hypothetical protein BKA70DRAFT_1423365 [Coprinopsis sp. MPI-PUGE-AT-0042]|nr:hypothetical protein BKA70DRAFT_1423365 [Coprinopsis sp. MPI-PUGE-AT-0042]